jgi:hypothetical protein
MCTPGPTLDIRIFLCACSTLRSPSLCSSWSFRSGDHRLERTHHNLHIYTSCRRKAHSGISWMMMSSTGHGWCATCWEVCLLGLDYEVRQLARSSTSHVPCGADAERYFLSGVGLPSLFHDPRHPFRMVYQKWRGQPHSGICRLGEWR